MHNPEDVISLKKARRQIKYEELFTYLLKIAYMKKKITSDEFGIARSIDNAKIIKFMFKISKYNINDKKRSILLKKGFN